MKISGSEALNLICTAIESGSIKLAGPFDASGNPDDYKYLEERANSDAFYLANLYDRLIGAKPINNQ